MSPVDYHGWTHARKEDGGTDPIPFPPSGDSPAFFRAWLMRFSGSPAAALTTGGIGNEQLEFDWWETSDASVFVPRITGGASGSTPVIGTHSVDRVRLFQPGHYTISFGVKLDSDSQELELEWNDGDAPFGSPDGNTHREENHTAKDSRFNVQPLTRIYPLPDFGAGGGAPDGVDDYWPLGFGNGTAFVEGFITFSIAGAANAIDFAFLEILFHPLTIPPA